MLVELVHPVFDTVDRPVEVQIVPVFVRHSLFALLSLAASVK